MSISFRVATRRRHPARRRSPRLGAALAILLAATVPAGCGDLLGVTNPRFITEDQLTNPGLQRLVVNGAVGEMQYAYGYYALYSSAMTDESFIDHTQVDIRELTLRNIQLANTVNAAIYSNLHRARQSAEDAVIRLKAMLGEAAAAKHLDVATVQAYGGYAYLLLGEGFCESTINGSAPVPSDEMLRKAITLFEAAITTATASGTSAASTDILNMARVGGARAALKVGDATKARNFAAAVPATYEKWMWYSANSVRENNLFNVPAGVSGSWMSMGPVFQALADPRVPKTNRTTLRGLNSNPIFPPQRPLMYSGWTGGSALQENLITTDTDINFATGLEARYVVAELNGPVATTLAFINERRAVGGKPAVTLAGDAMMAELRTQRAIDFYLTGQRLGDLRRYKARSGVDLFPTGKFPITTDQYGTATCFVIPQTERNANKNIP